MFTIYTDEKPTEEKIWNHIMIIENSIQNMSQKIVELEREIELLKRPPWE